MRGGVATTPAGRRGRTACLHGIRTFAVSTSSGAARRLPPSGENTAMQDPQ